MIALVGQDSADMRSVSSSAALAPSAFTTTILSPSSLNVVSADCDAGYCSD